jgi:2-oxoglutarate dehydrogenase E2 component (dihydrolipoamide succinyltransferase)
MAVEIKVPALGESVTEATVAKWLVKAGDAVTIDQPLCELETDKVTVEVNATVAGTMVDLAVEEGATVQVGGVLCHIEAGAAGVAAAKPAVAPVAAAPTPAPCRRDCAGGSRGAPTCSAPPSASCSHRSDAPSRRADCSRGTRHRVATA